MTQAEIEQLTALSESLGVEVYHTDTEETNYYKSDGGVIDETWIPKSKDIVIIRHRSLGSLWNWQNKVALDRMKKEVNHGS